MRPEKKYTIESEYFLPKKLVDVNMQAIIGEGISAKYAYKINRKLLLLVVF